MKEPNLETELKALQRAGELVAKQLEKIKANSYGLETKPHAVIIKDAAIVFTRTSKNTFTIVGRGIALKDEGKEIELFIGSDLTLTLPLVVQDP